MLFLSVRFFLLKQLVLLSVIGFLYSASNYVLELNCIKKVSIRRCIVDNLTHISLGIISWLISISFDKIYQFPNIVNCLLCGFFAGLVDVDHFLMAKSFNLNDALNLSSRPPFHNTTLMFISILSFIIIMHINGFLKFSYGGWILLVAVISHHLRDALHRGLWLWPVQLKPMKKFSYLVLTYCFPTLIGILIRYLYKSQYLTVNSSDFVV